MIWRMGKGQMRLLIISPAQVMMDPDSDVLWHWERTETDFFILSSQQVPNQEDVLDVFFFFFLSWAAAAVRFLVRAFMLGCKYLREKSVTSFPPDLPQTRTHICASSSVLHYSNWSSGCAAFARPPPVSLSFSLSPSMSKSHLCLFVTSLSPSVCQFSVELNSA